MSIVKAEITEVQVGSVFVEGLMSEGGRFGIGVPQYAELFQTSTNTASRDLKRILSKASETSIVFKKWSTPYNPKPINVILLEQWADLLLILAFDGNTKAQSLVRALHGLSWHQLFCDAFGQKFEAEDRQRWLETRVFTRKEFRLLTDQLQKYGFTDGRQYARYISRFQAKLGIENGTRDELTTERLVMLQSAQVKITTMMDCGLDPWDALDKFKP